MPVLKLNISYEDHLKLKEASEFYGVPIQELYRKMADDYIAKIREIDDENKKATLSERIRGKRIDIIAAIAYRRVKKRKMKEKKGKPAEMTEFPAKRDGKGT